MNSPPSSVRVRAWEKKLIEDRGISVSDIFHFGARCIKEGVVRRGGSTDINLVISGEPPAPRAASSQTAIAVDADQERGKSCHKTAPAGPCRIGILAQAEHVPGPGGARRLIEILDRIE